MRNYFLLLTLTFLLFACNDKIQEINDQQPALLTLPKDTHMFDDIVYKTVDGKNLALDLYIPDTTTNKPPLIVWTHGGAWMRGSKEAFIDKNNRLINALLNNGYAIASIGYRLSGEAIFPAQIQDCNDAIDFLYQNSEQYNFDRDRIASMGRSAGGHLAALVATSNSHEIADFNTKKEKPEFKIRALVDFFGPSDFISMRGKGHDEDDAPEAKLLGISPLKAPKLAKKASPVTYVNSETPPTLLLHGLDDTIVPSSQSEIFKSHLDNACVTNEIHLVEGARHGDRIFDSTQYVDIVIDFLKRHFPAN